MQHKHSHLSLQMSVIPALEWSTKTINAYLTDPKELKGLKAQSFVYQWNVFEEVGAQLWCRYQAAFDRLPKLQPVRNCAFIHLLWSI